MSLSAHQALSLLLVALTALAAVCDVRRGLIPNRLVLAGALLGLSGHLAWGAAQAGAAGALRALGFCALGVVASATLPLALYAAKGLGGGDVKLFMAMGVLAGPIMGLEAQLYAFVAGGLYGAARLAYEGVLLRSLASSLGDLVRGARAAGRYDDAISPARSMRFAPAICAGACLATLLHWSTP